MTATDFEQMIERYHAAMLEIVRGNAQPGRDIYSDADDVTLANPFGGIARGPAEVADRLVKAAANYRDGEIVSFESVATHVTDDIAYLVEIERFRARVGSREHADEIALRVTSILRREGGDWRVVHRQADTRVDPQAPESVI